MPQVDLSQILGSVFGAVGRGGGIGMMPPPHVAMAASGVTVPAASIAPGGPPPSIPQQLGQPHGMPPPSMLAGLLSPQMPSPTGPPGTSPATMPAPMATDMGNVQIVFQQDFGNLSQMLPAMFGDAMQITTETVVPQGVNLNQSNAVPGAANANLVATDQLPWRDLRRLHQHLGRLLGRSSHNRTIPPPFMPGGELNAFLTMLVGATTQLSVAISDLQASYLDGTFAQPRYRLQLAMALVAAARTLRGMATVLQSGPLHDTQAASTSEGSAVQPSGEQTPAPQAGTEQAPTSQASEPNPRSPSSGSEEDNGREIEGAIDGMEVRVGDDEVLEVFLDPLEDVFPAGPHGTVIAATDGSDQAAEMLQQLMGQLATPASAQFGMAPVVGQVNLNHLMTSVPEEPDEDEENQEEDYDAANELLSSVVGQANLSSQPSQQRQPLQQQTDDALSEMPPEVAAAWHRWTKSDTFAHVVAQANQPVFSHAYVSGDSTGSHRLPQLPEPEQFLPLRWDRTVARMEDSVEPPEPPEHLSRAYLSAFLRDLGHHLQGNSAFRNEPEAAERFPHLHRVEQFFADNQSAGAGNN